MSLSNKCSVEELKLHKYMKNGAHSPCQDQSKFSNFLYHGQFKEIPYFLWVAVKISRSGNPPQSKFTMGPQIHLLTVSAFYIQASKDNAPFLLWMLKKSMKLFIPSRSC